MNTRSGQSEVNEHRRATPRFTGVRKFMTRYAPDQDRPSSTSQLTRYAPERSRDASDDVAAGRTAPPLQEIDTTPAAAPVRPAPSQQRAQPKAEAVQPADPQPLRSTHADLYSDAPITISILKRALPRRFADIESGKAAGFNGPPKQSAQFGLTHAIRPLKSLFPHDPS